LRVFEVPVIDAKLRLLCGGVFFVADESDLCVVFVPGEALVFSFAADECGWLIFGAGFDCVDAVGFFVAGGDCVDQCFGVLADGEVEDVGELAFGAGGRVAQDEF
jgi:hypothetical protein